jgi:putative flippase GtrA
MMLTNAKERGRFIRFAIVGAIGFVIDFGVFNLLKLLIPFFYTNARWAQAISFALAASSNYYWNRKWTFPDSRSKSVRKQFLQFFIVSLLGLTIRTPLFTWLQSILLKFYNSWWTLKFVTPTDMADNTSLAIVILVVMLWNFIANRYWTYNDVSA